MAKHLTMLRISCNVTGQHTTVRNYPAPKINSYELEKHHTSHGNGKKWACPRYRSEGELTEFPVGDDGIRGIMIHSWLFGLSSQMDGGTRAEKGKTGGQTDSCAYDNQPFCLSQCKLKIPIINLSRDGN